jgi:hypothetical protein
MRLVPASGTMDDLDIDSKVKAENSKGFTMIADNVMDLCGGR